MTGTFSVNDPVVLNTASTRLTLGTVVRVLADKIEVALQSPLSRTPEYTFCSPEDCVRV